MLFRSVAPEVVKQAFENSVADTVAKTADELRAKIQQDIRRARVSYEGGEAAIELLMRKDGELPSDWYTRRNHYRNVPVLRRGVRKQAWLAYGEEPALEVWIGDRPPSQTTMMLASKRGKRIEDDEDTNEYSEWVRDTLESNNNAKLVFNAAIARIRDGMAVLKVWGIDENGTAGALPFSALRMDLFPREDAIPIYDPDDRNIILGVLEFRAMQQAWWLWTAERIDKVDGGLNFIESVGDHPIPGTIPFAFYGDGKSLVGDLVEYQKVLINRHSTQWAVERAQSFPVGEMRGQVANEQIADQYGVHGINIGGGLRYLYFPDTQGGFRWVAPEAPLAELRASYLEELKEALWLGAGLSSDVGGGATPEQPMTLAIRWLDAFIDRDQLISEAIAFEDARQRILAAYASEYNDDFGLPSFDAAAVDWEVRFPDTPLPHDDREDRRLAKEEVIAGLRLKSQYVQEYVMPEADAEELGEIMEILEEDNKSAEPEFNFGPTFGEDVAGG